MEKGRNRQPGRNPSSEGWAGQWDRHHWKVKVTNPHAQKAPDPEQSNRPAALERHSPWNGPPSVARPGSPTVRISKLELGVMILGGVFMGLAAWVSI